MELITIKWSDESKRQLEEAEKAFSEEKVTKALQRIENDTIKHAKAVMGRGVSKMYTVKKSRIQKGLSVKFANTSDLQAQVNAEHKPISLSEFRLKTKLEDTHSGATGNLIFSAKKRKTKDGIKTKFTTSKRSVGVISVQPQQGSGLVSLRTAFIPGVAANNITGLKTATSAIFARGKRGNTLFKFATDNSRDIDVLKSNSIGTMVLNAKTKKIYEEDVSGYLDKRTEYHLNQLYKNNE